MFDELRKEQGSSATYRKIVGRLMPLLMLIYVVSFIDRTNIGVAKLQFTKDLGFTEAAYGFGSGIFYLGYILLEIPSNIYLARTGVRKTLLRIMVLWGLCCAAMSFMSQAWHFYGLRFLLGAAEAGLFPGMLLYLSYWIPPGRHARNTAMFMASIPIAGILGGPLAGLIMHNLEGVYGLAGWQWLFAVEGLPAVILGFVAYLYLQDGPAQCGWLSREEKLSIAADLASQPRNDVMRRHDSLASLLFEPRFYAVAFLGCALMVSVSALFLWVPTLIKYTGVKDVVDIGLLSSLPFIVGLVGQWANARHSDRTMERRWHAAVPALIAGSAWPALPLTAGHTVPAMLVITVAAAGTLSAMGPFWSLPATLLSKTTRASGIALITTVAGAGNFFSPILVGWLATRTGSLVIGQHYFGAVLMLGAIFLIIGARPSQAGDAIDNGLLRSRAAQP